jgi:hypothetical protein
MLYLFSFYLKRNENKGVCQLHCGLALPCLAFAFAFAIAIYIKKCILRQKKKDYGNSNIHFTMLKILLIFPKTIFL